MEKKELSNRRAEKNKIRAPDLYTGTTKRHGEIWLKIPKIGRTRRLPGNITGENRQFYANIFISNTQNIGRFDTKQYGTICSAE